MAPRKPGGEMAVVADDEKVSTARLDALLAQAPDSALRLDGVDGEIEIPPTVLRTLRHLVHLLARDGSVRIVPAEGDVSLEEAAHLLNLTVPLLDQLLARGALAAAGAGAERRLKLAEVLRYRDERARRRRQALDRLVGLSEEAGLYEREQELFSGDDAWKRTR
jgi:hypothetical protein